MSMAMRINAPFRDRLDASQRLAAHAALQRYKGRPADAVVIGLPRGGIPMAAHIAKELAINFDMVVPRKIGHPGHREYGIGALTETGAVFMLPGREQMAQRGDVQAIIREEQQEAQRRMRTYRAGRPPLDLRGKTAILVDDGIATGVTMRAALVSAKQAGAARTLVAVPVAPPDAEPELRGLADEVVILETPYPFQAVGLWYQNWDQVEDDEVIKLMQQPQIPVADAAATPTKEADASEVKTAEGGDADQPHAAAASY